jgi:phosphatidylinositol glycan class V
LVSLSLAQAALALVALTNYHVQIITRLASGYPIWYIWVAEVLVAESGDGEKKKGRWVVMFMVLYALIQGVLFASFLPPA